MKSRKLFIALFVFLTLLLMCGKKSNPANSENNPPECDISGSWTINITVTGGNQLPVGTQFAAVIEIIQADDGDVTGSITTEGGLTSEVTGNVSDYEFSFKIKQNPPCTGTFKGSGTITEQGTQLDGSYSGDDCNGTMKAGFSSIDFIPFIRTSSVTDIDGNTYKTIKLGNQWWMAENLKVTRYRNNDAIPNVPDSTEFSGLTTGTYSNYNNDANNVAVYGRLYNWYAVVDSRHVAPAGWHVPSDAEWKELEMFLGMSQSEADNSGVRNPSVAGKLKEAGITHWRSPNFNATNESQFSSLPGGQRGNNGHFSSLGFTASFWSSTEDSTGSAWYRGLIFLPAGVSRMSYPVRNAFSVRCVRN